MKKFLVFLFAAALLLTQGSSVFAFNDVTQDDFYYDSVDFLADEGIVMGYPDGSFGYDLTINRAELLTIVVKAAGVSLDSAQWVVYGDESCFADTEPGQWYTKFVCYAEAQDWVAGYPDDTFRPGNPVNFVEALKITMNALEIDSESGTSPWYKGIVDSASAKNLIPLTITSFGQEIMRGEMTDLIARILKYKAGELDEWLGLKKDYVVTYSTIENGKGMYGEYIDDTVEPLSTDVVTLIDTFSSLDGFSTNPGFKSILDGGFLVSGDGGIKMKELVYFSIYKEKEGNGLVSGGYVSRLIEYNIVDDAGEVIFQFDSDADDEDVDGLPVLNDAVILEGVDLVNDDLVFGIGSPVYYFTPPTACSSRWLLNKFYSIDIDAPDNMDIFKVP